jgi:hypothetical protein
LLLCLRALGLPHDGFVGQRWIDEVQLRDVPYEKSQERYTLEQNVTTALGEGVASTLDL